MRAELRKHFIDADEFTIRKKIKEARQLLDQEEAKLASSIEFIEEGRSSRHSVTTGSFLRKSGMISSHKNSASNVNNTASGNVFNNSNRYSTMVKFNVDPATTNQLLQL